MYGLFGRVGARRVLLYEVMVGWGSQEGHPLDVEGLEIGLGVGLGCLTSTSIEVRDAGQSVHVNNASCLSNVRL